MKRPIVFTLLLPLLAGLLWVSRAQCAEIPVVAAAADLKFALTEAAQTFAAKTGRQVKLSFGSSGNFATQIINGAPFELFLSADEAYVKMLSQRGLAVDDGVLYAVGRIGLYVPKGSSVKADGELRGLSAAVAAGQVKRFAIANPEHAPYGRAAREALMKAALWDRLKGKLVLGENVGQAAQFALTGSVEAAIIPYSLALAPELAQRGEFALIADSWHRPLRQRMALLKGAGETAKEFYGFLQQREARAVFERYGFTLPAKEK